MEIRYTRQNYTTLMRYERLGLHRELHFCSQVCNTHLVDLPGFSICVLSQLLVVLSAEVGTQGACHERGRSLR